MSGIDLEEMRVPYCALENDEAQTIEAAKAILARRLFRDEPILSTPRDVKDYLILQLAELEHEVFGVIWLDASHRVIAIDHLFRGTITQTSVYPREVVKVAMHRNAGAAVMFHNHPSGVSTSSKSDETLTRILKETLALVDVKVIDHFVIGGTEEPLSFAERGLI